MDVMSVPVWWIHPLTLVPRHVFEVVDEYGAYFSPTELRDVDPSRAYRHSSRYYIIDQQGDIIDAMRHSATANEIVARLRTLI